MSKLLTVEASAVEEAEDLNSREGVYGSGQCDLSKNGPDYLAGRTCVGDTHGSTHGNWPIAKATHEIFWRYESGGGEEARTSLAIFFSKLLYS